MTTLACKKCGSIDLFTKLNGTQTGLYCSDCGTWLKWIGKEEQRLFERQKEELIKIIPENAVLHIDLSQVSIDDLLNEIRRRIIS